MNILREVQKFIEHYKKTINRLFALLGFLIISIVLFNLGTTTDLDQLKQINAHYFMLAALFSVLGFFCQALSWKYSIQAENTHYGALNAIHDHGITIFTKYIPGKVFAVASRAFLASSNTGITLTLSLIASTKNMLICLAVGTVLPLAYLALKGDLGFLPALAGITLSDDLDTITQSLLLLVAILVVVYIAKKKALGKQQVWVCLLYGLNWLLWILGFMFLSSSITGHFDLSIGAIYCLAICLGVIAIFAPGGLGVREGFFWLALTTMDYSAETAATLALASRLWFVLGELGIFVMAFLLRHRFSKKDIGLEKAKVCM